jgi:predicted helicase
MFDVPTSIPNLNRELVSKIESKLGLKLDWEAPVGSSYSPTNPSPANDMNGLGVFSPTDLLDYIYGILHSPTYRETYKEFLKIDFPSVPFGGEWMKLIGKASNIVDEFWRIVDIGGQLRRLHLMESVLESIASYPESGDNKVSKIRFEKEKVWINETQYFEGVSEVTWSFYIGGYQPAQKWLKDRKDTIIDSNDIAHYSQIISCLAKTDALMKLIDY